MCCLRRNVAGVYTGPSLLCFLCQGPKPAWAACSESHDVYRSWPAVPPHSLRQDPGRPGEAPAVLSSTAGRLSLTSGGLRQVSRQACSSPEVVPTGPVDCCWGKPLARKHCQRSAEALSTAFRSASTTMGRAHGETVVVQRALTCSAREAWFPRWLPISGSPRADHIPVRRALIRPKQPPAHLAPRPASDAVAAAGTLQCGWADAQVGSRVAQPNPELRLQGKVRLVGQQDSPANELSPFRQAVSCRRRWVHCTAQVHCSQPHCATDAGAGRPNVPHGQRCRASSTLCPRPFQGLGQTGHGV